MMSTLRDARRRAFRERRRRKLSTMSSDPHSSFLFEAPAWEVERSGQRYRERHWLGFEMGRREDETFTDVVESVVLDVIGEA